MHVYGLKSCDTCRKAQAALREAGHDLQVIDVRADGVPADHITLWLAEFGEALINRRSTTWRGLSEDERAGDAAALLAAHPTLMKRPVIQHEGRVYLGWSKDVQAALIG